MSCVDCGWNLYPGDSLAARCLSLLALPVLATDAEGLSEVKNGSMGPRGGRHCEAGLLL